MNVLLCFPHSVGHNDLDSSSRLMMRRDREVIDFTRYRVKNNTELTNLMKMYRIKGIMVNTG